MKARAVLATAAALLAALPAGAAPLALAQVFGEHMVLQRGEPLALWGRGTPGQALSVALGPLQAQVQVDAQGRWRATLPALPAGGPHEIALKSGAEQLRLADVWIGDVWLCGGQSNMAWPLSLTIGGPEAVATSEVPLIRHLRVPNRASLLPQEEIAPAPWVVAKPGATADFSAVGWHFARRLQAEPMFAGVPIGLVNVAWSGSHLETWVRRDAALAEPDLAAAVRAMPADDAAFVAFKREQVGARIDRFQPGLRWPAADSETWNASDLDDAAWPTLRVPTVWEAQGLSDLDGVVWVRRIVTLTAEQARGAATLSLGMIDDCDDSYVNGQRVGGLCQYDAKRRHPVPAGLLREGRNVIAVKVTDHTGGGGFHGDPAAVRLETVAGHLPLAGTWKARIASPKFPASPEANDGPSLAHNGLVHPLRGLKWRGVIWYQGESNTGRAVAYAGLFQRVISDWRASFGQPGLPFLFVQLSSFHPLAANSWQQSGWAELREAQRQALALPNTGMAVTIDVGDPDDIHPRDKRTVGERLALQALHLADPKRPAARGPQLREAKAEGGRFVLTFDVGGLATRKPGAPLAGFALAGADRRFHPAQARFEGGRVIVESAAVAAPQAVRYAWLDNPMEANLVGPDGLPAGPFRSDDWPLSTANARYAP